MPLQRFLVFLFVNVINCEKSRIIGGENALSGQFPFVASLQYKRTHFCAATIISKFHILTAAHCVLTIYDILTNYNGTIYDFVVVVGTVVLDYDGDVYFIEKIPYNIDWFNKTGMAEDDFAVLQVRGEIILSNSVKLANIYGGFIASDIDVYILGWGYTTNKIKLSKFLKYAKTKTISNSECGRYYGKKIDVNHLCTLGFKGHRTCSGDSGGPLITVDGGKLIGIQSQGGIDCSVMTPDIYARISPEKISSLIFDLRFQ